MATFHILHLMSFVLITASSALKINLTPKNSWVHVEDSLTVVCHASGCKDTVAFLWNSLQDKPLYSTPKNEDTRSVLHYNSITMEMTNNIFCQASCKGEKTVQQTTQLKVYALPQDPIISGHDHLTMGREGELKCTVPKVHPVEHLRIEWLHNDTVVFTQKDFAEAHPVVSVYKFTPGFRDNRQAVSCRATLDIDKPSGLDQRTREAVAPMSVHYAPSLLTIHGNLEVNVGGKLTLSCLANGNPIPTFVWRQHSSNTISVIGKGQTLLVEDVSWSDDGQYECQADNTVATSKLKVTVKVSGPPVMPVLSVSPSRHLREGANMTISCKSNSGPKGTVKLHQVNAGQESELLSNQGSTYALITVQSVKASHTGSYECVATNPLGSKTTSTSVTVQENIKTINISGNTDVQFGEILKLTCHAKGSPKPTLVWKKLSPDGELLLMEGEILLVKEASWAHSGLYQCQTSNTVVDGLTAYVRIKVQGPPVNLSMEVFPSKEVKEGMNVTVFGRAVAVPAASTTLVRTRDGMITHSANGTFHLGYVSLSDAGLYLLNFTNQLGQQSLNFSLTVQGKSTKPTPDLPKIIGPAVGSISLLTAAGILIKFLRRKTQAGKYKLEGAV